MNLSTRTIVRFRTDPVNDVARGLVAVVCAAGAGIHGALAPRQLHESLLIVPAATAVAYVLSRSTGLPGVNAEVEPVNGLGLTTLFELTGVAACLLLILRREHR